MKMFIVESAAVEYNDEYYYQPEEGVAPVRTVYTTRERAQTAADAENLAQCRAVLADGLGSWLGEGNSLATGNAEDDRKLHELLLGPVEEATAKRIERALNDIDDVPEERLEALTDDDCRWLIKLVGWPFECSDVQEVEVVG